MRQVHDASYPSDYGPGSETSRATYYGDLAEYCMARHAANRPEPRLQPPANDTSCYYTEARVAQDYFDSGYTAMPRSYAAAVCAKLDYCRFHGDCG